MSYNDVGNLPAKAAHLLSKTRAGPNGCMEYTGCVQANGYSRATVRRKTDYGHRHMYRLMNGPIPEGLDVRHKCDNRRCINPDHLIVGTRKQNMEDAVDRGRQARGSMLPQTKLTDAATATLIQMAKDGVPYQAVGEVLGLCRQHVGQIAIKNGIYRYGLSK